MGLVVSHPHAVQVSCEDGNVTLSGPILEREAKRFLRRVRKIPGVREIHDQLERHHSADNEPALQGGSPRIHRPELLQQNWTPALRFVAVALGGAGAIAATSLLGGLPRAVGVGVGSLFALRGLTNLPTKRMVGVGAGRRAIDVQKHIHIQAPPGAVFAFWASFDNLPRFMSHLRSVEVRDDRRSHWVAAGPAGVPVSWDAELTRYEPNSVLAWKSVEHSAVKSAGVVRFEPDGEGGTHVHVQMSYNPPAGALGHAVATLFGADPKHAMDQDLLRLKSLLETGKATAHGHTVRRFEVPPHPPS
jgi:uncharacterized membrane protein